MKDRQLFHSKKAQHYFIRSQSNFKCGSCEESLFGICFHITIREKRKEKYFFLCEDCNKIGFQKDFGKVIQERTVIVSDVLPFDCVPVLASTPSLNDGNLSTFDIKGIDKRYSDSPNKTVDKTRLAGRESFEGAIVGDMAKVIDNDNKKQELLKEKGVKYLIDATR